MLAIYCRISKKKEEGIDTSIEVQKNMGLLFANKIDELYRVYKDEGISGQKDEEDRPAFAQMLQDIKKGDITGVWVYDQSRIERSPRIWHLFVYIINEHKVKYFPAGVDTDLDDPHTELVTGILSLTNKMFAKLTGQKVKKSLEANIGRGKYHGMTAFGYRKDDKGYLKIDKAQSEVIKRIFKLSLEGIGSYTIANILNENKVPTKYNDFEGVIKKKDSYTKEVTPFNKKDVKWRGNVVYDIITNTIYKGKLKWGGIYYDAPAIITTEHWQEVNDNLEKNKKKVGKREEYNYLLNGIIVCENCGKPMRGKKREKGSDSAYKCGGGMGCRGMSIEKLETFIIKHLFYSKELRKLLNEFPSVGGFKNKTLNLKLENKNAELNQVNNLLKKMLTIVDEAEDEDLFASRFKQARQRKIKLTKEITDLEKEISEMGSNFAINNFNKLADNFSVDQPFENVKVSIHSLIKEIKIGHFKKAKGGYFIIRLEYKRFEDVSIFTSDYQLMKWNWIQHYRNGFTNSEEKKDDLELFEYLNSSEVPKEFDGYETTSIMHDQIIFTKDEMITFN